jgi:hypothetical protein
MSQFYCHKELQFSTRWFANDRARRRFSANLPIARSAHRDTDERTDRVSYCNRGAGSHRSGRLLPWRGLVTKSPNSPHQQAAKSKAQFLIATAANDDQRAPDDKNVLKETFEKANLPAKIEVYTGAAHGWCPPHSGVYNKSQAEKAWGRLLALYGKLWPEHRAWRAGTFRSVR